MSKGRHGQPVEQVVETWPDELAFPALAQYAEGRLNATDIRRIEAWRRHLANRGLGLWDAGERDWQDFGSASRLRDLAHNLACVYPALAAPARDAISQKQLAKRGRSSRTRRGRGRDCETDKRHVRSKSLPESEWPRAWQRARQRLRDRQNGDDLDPDDGGPAVADGTLKTLDKAVSQLALIVVEEEWPATIQIPLVERWTNCLQERGVASSSVATWMMCLHIFARELRADPDVLAHVRTCAERHQRRARRQRSEKQRKFLQIDFDIGDVFQCARDLNARAQAASPHEWGTVKDYLEAALLALSVAAPMRCGDLGGLRLGHDLMRTEEGWWIDTAQEKTGEAYETATLWDEVGRILDDAIVRGSGENLWQRLRDRAGTPLFAWGDDGSMPLNADWPSQVWRKFFAVGIHIVRSMWGTLYGERYPERAWAATALLGHSSEKTKRYYEVRSRRAHAVGTCQDLIEEMLPKEWDQ